MIRIIVALFFFFLFNMSVVSEIRSGNLLASSFYVAASRFFCLVMLLNVYTGVRVRLLAFVGHYIYRI